MNYYSKYLKYKKKYLSAKKQLNLTGGDLNFTVTFKGEEIPRNNIGEYYYEDETTYQQLRNRIAEYLNKDAKNVFFTINKETRKLSEPQYDNEIEDDINRIIVTIDKTTVDPIAEGIRQNKLEIKSGRHLNEENFKLPNGSIYKGEMINDIPHGKGHLTNPNGYSYQGEFKDGKYDGQGKEILPNGDSYQGKFKDGIPNGQGIKTKINGYKYEGGFKDGKYDGEGKLTLPNGTFYEGKFRDGRPSGQE